VTIRKEQGVVDLYILVIGSFNPNILNHYPGVRFIWGLNQLSTLMGSKSLDYLQQNTRFRIISIYRMKSDLDLTKCDNNYKKVIVYSEVQRTLATYTCLNNSQPDDFRRYFTNKFNLHSISEVSFDEEKPHGNYRLSYQKERKEKRILIRKEEIKNKFQKTENLFSYYESDQSDDDNDEDWSNK